MIRRTQTPPHKNRQATITKAAAKLSVAYGGGMFTLLSGQVMACSCMWGGKLEETAIQAPVVIRAKIVESSSFVPRKRFTIEGEKREAFESIKVETLEVLKGPANESSFVLFGDNGMLCRPYLLESEFKLGGEYLFVLASADQEQPLSVCGEHWSRVKDGRYFGRNRDGESYESELQLLRHRLR